MIKSIEIKLNCENEAMQTEEGLAWVLDRLANDIRTGDVDDDCFLYDLNGNRVGRLYVEHGEEAE